MFDFENAMKIIVALGSGALVLLMLGIGVKVLFFRKSRLPASVDAEQLAGMDDRLARAEAKVAELEERLDFAERMLTEVRGKAPAPRLNP